MPRININEINSTTSTPVTTTAAQPVALAGTATKGEAFSPIICATEAQFRAAFGNNPPANYSEAYLAAREILKAGNTIIYTRIATAADNVTSASYTQTGTVGSESSADIIKIEAVSGGTWGNSLSITLSASTVVSGVKTYAVTVSDTGSIVNSGKFELTSTPVAINTVLYSDNYVKITALAAVSSGTPTVADISGQTLSGGADGDALTASNVLTAVESTLKKLQDPSLFDFTVFAMPGLSYMSTGDNTSTTLGTVWGHFVEFTQPGTILSTPIYDGRPSVVMLVDSDPTTENSSSILEDLKLSSTGAGYNYLAIFYPWYTSYDEIKRDYVPTPPTTAYLKAFAVLGSDGIPCRPVAGYTSANVTNVASVYDKVGSILSNTLTDMCINPIVYHRNYGYFIDGNRVFNPEASNNTYKQLSIRQTINFIKRRLDELCFQLSYKNDLVATQQEFMGQASALLDQLKQSNFIYGYSIAFSTTSSDISDGVLNALVKVFPTPATEEFIINLQIVNLEEDL